MADETTKFESCQALFCAFVDLVGRADSKTLFFEKGKFPGKMLYETYEDFIKVKKVKNLKINVAILMKKAYESTYTPEMSFLACEEFLKSKSAWFHSSVVIAVKLIIDLHTGTAGGISLAKYKTLGTRDMQSIDYYRGDTDVMGNIEKICRICMKNTEATAKVIKTMKAVPFKDPNKWSPADIYYASKKAKIEIAAVLKEAQDDAYEPTYYYHLNDMIYDLMVSGDLLGVSLKKQPDPSKVKIELVNFSGRIKKALLNQVSYNSHNIPSSQKKFKNVPRDPKGGKREVKAPPKSKKKVTIKWPGKEVPTKQVTSDMPGRDFVVSCKIGKQVAGNIQMRHDPSNNGWKVDWKGVGAGARGGSVTSLKLFCDIWQLVDPTEARIMRTKGNNARDAFTAKVKKFMENKKEVQRLQQIPFTTITDAGKWITEGGKTWFRFKSSAYDFQKGEISATVFMNTVLPILTTWFNREGKAAKTQKDAFCRLIYQYVTSRHPESGKFIIVK
jgi:hypothetical protein